MEPDAVHAPEQSETTDTTMERERAHPTGSSTCAAFQEAVDTFLIRHRSILDILSKGHEGMARLNRAVVKAVTACGCLQVEASAQKYPMEGTLLDIREHMSSHVRGTLCEHCRDAVDAELGRTLFYLTALCNLFDLRLDHVIAQETQRLSTLGIYNLT